VPPAALILPAWGLCHLRVELVEPLDAGEDLTVAQLEQVALLVGHPHLLLRLQHAHVAVRHAGLHGPRHPAERPMAAPDENSSAFLFPTAAVGATASSRSLRPASMSVPGDLTSFLSDISAKDELLRKASSAVPRSGASAPPIRGKEGAPPPAPQKPPLQKKLPAAEPAAPPRQDAAAIWDDDETTSAGPPSRPGPAASPEFDAAATFAGARPGYVFRSGGRGVGYYADGAAAPERVGGKTSHRKHAYEYFSDWDRFDVDGEMQKLDGDTDTAAGRAAPAGAASEEDGLPAGLTAETLRDMPKVEVERRALNEKAKGNEHYKAGDFEKAVRCYTHALRLDSTNAAVFANRAVCNLKLKRYKLAISDSDAAIQLDDG
jgi:hypothetical protein